MILHSAIVPFLSYRLKYNYECGPDVVSSIETALTKGINCVSLAHILLSDFYHVHLTSNFKCIEMFYHNNFLRNITDEEEFVLGDILFFGKEGLTELFANYIPRYNEGTLVNGSDFPGLHVGIYTGNKTTETIPLIIHASFIDKGVSVWPLDKFLQYPRYKKIYAVKRLNMLG